MVSVTGMGPGKYWDKESDKTMTTAHSNEQRAVEILLQHSLVWDRLSNARSSTST
jgi:hypothetical protein